jgi:translation elongation factor EF-Tu-like GTPase
MGWWPFGRKPTDDKDVDVLLAQAEAASPTGTSGGFRLTIQDVFSITGRGTVVVGRVEAGRLSTGQRVAVVRAGATVATTYVTGIEKFRAHVETAMPGENVGLLVGLARDQVQPGDVVQSG